MLEREPQPGGMAPRSSRSDGERWSYDFGPHRFHTTDPELIAHVQLDPRPATTPGAAALPDRAVRPLLRLPAAGRQRAAQPAAAGARALVPGLLLGPLHRARRAEPPQRRELRGLGGQAVRPHAVRAVLRPLHRQDVEDAAGADLRRLGQPADLAAEPGATRSSRRCVRPPTRPRGARHRASSTRARAGIGEIARGYVARARGAGRARCSPARRSPGCTPTAITITAVDYGGADAGHRRGRPSTSRRSRSPSLARTVRPAAPDAVRAGDRAACSYVSIVFIYLRAGQAAGVARQLAVPARART